MKTTSLGSPSWIKAAGEKFRIVYSGFRLFLRQNGSTVERAFIVDLNTNVIEVSRLVPKECREALALECHALILATTRKAKTRAK